MPKTLLTLSQLKKFRSNGRLEELVFIDSTKHSDFSQKKAHIGAFVKE